MTNYSAELSSGVKVTGLNEPLTLSSRVFIREKSKEALLEENKTSLQNVIKTAPDDYRANLNEYYVKIAFEDEKSKQLVSVNVGYGTVLNLMTKFKDENDFFLRDDGILRLNGKAQNFVSGWFEKVAYDMNLFGADKDKNGLVEGKELLETFYYQTPHFRPYLQGSELHLQGGLKIDFSKSVATENVSQRQMQTVLNGFLSLDKNMNGEISFAEYFGDEIMLLAQAEGLSSGGGGSSSSPISAEEIEKLKKWFEELMRKNTENIKKKVAEQGLASLSADELERFKIQNPTEYERLTQNQQKVESNNEELQALTDTLKQDFIKQIKEQSLSLIDIRA